uniref:Uncharacterized protein n=1 Tax=Molossus molossus TaxID=27622 RepID=A0A7J8EEP3_MOLMO|nr:hypothetical protein HJG59_008923 [Molossus molossus]
MGPQRLYQDHTLCSHPWGINPGDPRPEVRSSSNPLCPLLTFKAGAIKKTQLAEGHRQHCSFLLVPHMFSRKTAAMLRGHSGQPTERSVWSWDLLLRTRKELMPSTNHNVSEQSWKEILQPQACVEKTAARANIPNATS